MRMRAAQPPFCCARHWPTTWPANRSRMQGLGGWGKRDKKDGPYLRWRDGKIVRDDIDGPTGSHGPMQPFKIDVREPNEYEINKIPGSVLIPKGDFLNGSALEQLPGSDTSTQVVLHCKSGVRSAECLAIVKGAGYDNAVHVGGGVVAWVNQIDPSQPTY